MPTFDVIGTDPYPIPDKPVDLGRSLFRTHQTKDAVCGGRPIWQVPQVFNWANYQKNEADKAKYRAPTLEEMRSSPGNVLPKEPQASSSTVGWTFVAIAPRLLMNTGQESGLLQEIKEMIPVLLSVEEPPQVEIEPALWLNSLLKQTKGITYVVLVNNTREAHTARLRTPAVPESVVDRVDGKALVFPVGENHLELPLKPLAVRILQFRWKS